MNGFMKDEEKLVLFQEAISLAKKILSGELQPNLGCRQIEGIYFALGWPSDLAAFSLLAHEQYGHESIGITADNCVPDILAECKKLIEANN